MDKKPDKTPTIGVFVAGSPAAEAWECFGTVIDSAGRIGCVPDVLGALEAGEVRAQAKENPPITGNAVFDAAGEPSPKWWADYSTTVDGNIVPPAVWAVWLRSKVKLELAPTLHIFNDHLEAIRGHFGSRPRHSRATGAFSDLEALAWFASEDHQLVEKLRQFSHLADGTTSEARAAGFRYLSFHVALHHCRCGTSRPLLAASTPEGCSCVEFAWNWMVSSLREDRLPALLTSSTGNCRPVLPVEFLTAVLDLYAGRFAFLSEPGDLLFQQSDVQAALEAAKAPPEVFVQRVTDTSKNSQQSAPDPFTTPEIEEWIERHPQFSDVKTARKAFTTEPRARGQSAAFEVVWRRKYGRKRGRPKKQVHPS